MSDWRAAEIERESRELREKVAALEARIRELTKWRPMDTAPMDVTRIRLRHATTEREYLGWFDGLHFDVGGGRAWPPERFHGWLPSTEGGEG